MLFSDFIVYSAYRDWQAIGVYLLVKHTLCTRVGIFYVDVCVCGGGVDHGQYCLGKWFLLDCCGLCIHRLDRVCLVFLSTGVISVEFDVPSFNVGLEFSGMDGSY